LLATDELVLRQVRRLEIAMRFGFSRAGRRCLPSREVLAIERLLKQLLLQHHRLLQVRHVRVHRVSR